MAADRWEEEGGKGGKQREREEREIMAADRWEGGGKWTRGGKQRGKNERERETKLTWPRIGGRRGEMGKTERNTEEKN